VGLAPETIQTPYQELIRLCRHLSLRENDLVTDLGAGYGRLGIVLHHLYPEVQFRGIEFVPERVSEARRVYASLRMNPESISRGDLTGEDFFPEESDHYFVYDFGKVPHIRKLLSQLSEIADKRKFTLAGRGKGIRSLIAHEFHWLTPSYEEENFSIYKF
jgi:trans-aconitate methyltransferase